MIGSDDLKLLLVRATPGPWAVRPDDDIPGHREPDRLIIRDRDYDVGSSANARLIALSPTLAEEYLKLREAADAMADTLKRLEYWFDTDEELLLSMTGPERFDHERQHNMIRNALATYRKATEGET